MHGTFVLSATCTRPHTHTYSRCVDNNRTMCRDVYMSAHLVKTAHTKLTHTKLRWGRYASRCTLSTQWGRGRGGGLDTSYSPTLSLTISPSLLHLVDVAAQNGFFSLLLSPLPTHTPSWLALPLALKLSCWKGERGGGRREGGEERDRESEEGNVMVEKVKKKVGQEGRKRKLTWETEWWRRDGRKGWGTK